MPPISRILAVVPRPRCVVLTWSLGILCIGYSEVAWGQQPTPEAASTSGHSSASVHSTGSSKIPDAEAAQGSPSLARVKFSRHVAPILTRSCLRCHDGSQDSIDDLLVSRARAQRGGDSGLNLLALPLESNELIRRIRSETLGDRMPIGTGPLTEFEIDTLVRWIEQGAEWPAVKDAQPTHVWYVEWTFQVLEQYEAIQGDRFKPCGYLFLGLMCLLLVRQRTRESMRKGRTPSRLIRWVGELTPSTCLVGVLAIGLCGSWIWIRVQHESLRRLKAENLSRMPSGVSIARTIKPRHPDRLHGEYYRGNDERNEALFNGGYYRTCTFRIELRDISGQRIECGSPWPAQCQLHFEIIKSPFSAEQLFKQDNMTRVMLCDTPPNSPRVPQEARSKGLHPVPGRNDAWEADYPIDLSAVSSDGRHVHGTVYVYPKMLNPNVTKTTTAHYSVSFYLVEQDGLVGRKSGIWMESLLNVSSIDFPEPRRITPAEWFSSTPIPEIEGGNTSDPDLLGVTPHAGWLNLPPTPDSDAAARGQPPPLNPRGSAGEFPATIRPR